MNNVQIHNYRRKPNIIAKKVNGIEKTRAIARSSSILSRFKRVALRLYRADLAFQDSITGQNRVAKNSAFAEGYYVSQTELGRAILEAEHKKAMALMERQKHQRLC